MTVARRFVSALVGFLAVAVGSPAAAHPHVFVDAHSEIVFDKAGEVTAIHHIWQFDEAFTAFAVQGLDANHDGKLSDAELAPLAKVNIDSLKDYHFFTWLRQGRKSYPFVQPTQYWLEFHDARLTLFFTLPLRQPVAIHGRASLEVFDPEYFVAFNFPQHQPVTMIDAPPGCTAQYHPPQMLDSKTMAELAAVPASQHDLPPDLQNAAAALANLINLNCPGTPDASAVDPFEAVMSGAGGNNSAAPAAPRAPAAPAAAPLPQATPAAPDAVPAVGDLTAADIAATPGGPATQPPAKTKAGQAESPDAPAAAPPAQTPAVVANAATVAAAPAAPVTAEATTAGRSDWSLMLAIGLAVVLVAGIAVAGLFLQRSLRRTR